MLDRLEFSGKKTQDPVARKAIFDLFTDPAVRQTPKELHQIKRNYAKFKRGDIRKKRLGVDFLQSKEGVQLSAGPNMHSPYKWKNINDVASTGSASDSIKIPGKGTYITGEYDGEEMWTQDTIAVIERPMVDNVNKELIFNNPVDGVTYKIHKAEKTGNETTWVELPNLSFIGDGNAHIVDPGNGEFRVGVTKPGREEVIDTDIISFEFE